MTGKELRTKHPRMAEYTTEAARLRCLERLRILDTCPNEALDDVTRNVAAYFDVPVALVSLVDRDRQWFKSKYGLLVTQTPRDISF